MTSPVRKENYLFLGVSLGLFLALCIFAALVRIRVIYWYLANCDNSSACTIILNLISYWWAIFVPVVLFVAYLVNRRYQARVQRRELAR